MSKVVIKAESLGKRYRVGERERYVALRDVLAGVVTAPFRRNRQRHSTDYLWALCDVSVDVRQGEVVGLIGRNGAGKTTLLKILSRITRPTEGYAEIHGRVGSLLEVGTGFHPELTGRENVYLSGAILGMRKSEINRKFDEIVSFAGVERFIDTPLKHFSTGMQMRLAFAVAAHLEPEILLVDEVLAVGDIEFQKKCLGKMQDVSKSGRTIVFVSHQMNQIRRLCERILWIDAGQIQQSGPAGEVIAAYEAVMMKGSQSRQKVAGSSIFLSWNLASGENVIKEALKRITLNFTISPKEAIRRGHFGLHIHNDASISVASWGFDDLSIEAGIQQLRVTLPYLPLRPGTYNIVCSLFNGGNNLTGGKLLGSLECSPLSDYRHAATFASARRLGGNLQHSGGSTIRRVHRSSERRSGAVCLRFEHNTCHTLPGRCGPPHPRGLPMQAIQRWTILCLGLQQMRKVPQMDPSPQYGVNLQESKGLRKLILTFFPLHAFMHMRSEIPLIRLRWKSRRVRKQYRNSHNLMVNLGSGRSAKPGWVNVDVSKVSSHQLCL